MNVPILGPLVDRARRAVASAFDFSGLDLAALRRERARVIAGIDARNPPITRVLPVPRAVRLGGVAYVAAELTLGDVARLQAWLAEQVPHPLAEIPPAHADPEPETRAARLAVAWEAAKTWPPRYGSDAACTLLGTPQGRAYFLCLCLRPARPDFGLAGALGLLERITPLEWADLRRVAFGLTPAEEIADEIAPTPPDGRLANWALSLHRAGQAEGGPSYREAARWTVGQWRNFCAEGKAVEYSPEFGAQSRRVREILEAKKETSDESR